MSAPVAIVGAGMAGLACARRLSEAGLAPVVLDKGRGIGGRMATRRATLTDGTGVQFDHGAQYVTAREPGFAALLEGLAARGAAGLWQDGSGRQRWVGLPGMSGLPRAMAGGLEVRQSVQVTALRPGGAGWRIETGTGSMEVAAVVLTVPAPQAVALLGRDHPLASPLTAVRMDPCLTLMAAFPGDAPRTVLSEGSDSHPLAWIAQDSSKADRPGAATAWVAQAGPEWSAAHLEDDPSTLTARMLPLLAGRLGLDPALARHAAAHRWRYARVAAPLGQPFLRDGGLWLGGDWCLGARVEAAWQSGTAIAEDMLASGIAG